MRALVISDVHGNIDALRAVELQWDGQFRRFDRILCLGDLVDSAWITLYPRVRLNRTAPSWRHWIRGACILVVLRLVILLSRSRSCAKILVA